MFLRGLDYSREIYKYLCVEKKWNFSSENAIKLINIFFNGVDSVKFANGLCTQKAIILKKKKFNNFLRS